MLQLSYSIDNDNVTSNQTTTNDHQSWTKLTFVTFYMILPIAGLTLLWGRKDLLTKFLLQIDRNCVAVFCPSLSRRQKLLSWANGQLPQTWQIAQQQQSNGINDLWKNGSLLCNIINTIVPGACQNPYRHWKKPPFHAQALAYKYFQIPPLFAEKELSGDLTINQEHNFIHYLYELQQAINKWPAIQTTKDFDVVNHYKFSSQCVARGMGLYTGEQYRKTVFYIYTKNQSKHSDIFIFLRGPYGTKGKAIIPTTTNNLTIPTIHELRQRFNKNHSDINKRSSFLPNIPLVRSFINNNNGDTNKHDSNDIEIKVQRESDRTKIIYIPTNYGIYEINLIANGELFKGSPFHVNIVKNSSGIRDSFNQITINKSNRIRITKRRIISKTIDCIDETLIINDNNVQKMRNSQLCEIQENDNDDGVRLDTPDSSICTQDSGIDEQIKIDDHFLNRTIAATPICLDHIDCDVDRINCELINKRKRLNKQNSVNFSNSSFSTTAIDNDVGLDYLHKQNTSDDFEELSVMNVLATIKQSTKRSLNSTISLPDMTDLCHYEDVFKTKRAYWEKLSMQTSSTTSLIRVDHNYDNRCNSHDDNGREESEEHVYKSSFGSLKFDRCSNNFLANSKKFKSSDDTLDNCTIPTIEQRKRNLLKDRYDKEVVRTTNSVKELEIVRPQYGTARPVAERIGKLDSKGFYRNNTITNVIDKSPLRIDEVEQTKSNEKFKSPFKRAINYFRNLERTTKLIKIKYNNKKSPKRRCSADNNNNNDNKSNINKGRSTSLNLPNVSQRFSINNLYKDVTGGGCEIRRNSFKGAPNKNAVIDSLASLNYNQHLPKRNNRDLPEDECSIEYNLFVNRGKRKKRRSLCNLFEFHY